MHLTVLKAYCALVCQFEFIGFVWSPSHIAASAVLQQAKSGVGTTCKACVDIDWHFCFGSVLFFFLLIVWQNLQTGELNFDAVYIAMMPNQGLFEFRMARVSPCLTFRSRCHCKLVKRQIFFFSFWLCLHHGSEPLGWGYLSSVGAMPACFDAILKFGTFNSSVLDYLSVRNCSLVVFVEEVFVEEPLTISAT